MKEVIAFANQKEALAVLGSHDRNLRLIREALNVNIVVRNGVVRVDGTDEQVEQTSRAFQELRQIAIQRDIVRSADVETVLDRLFSTSEELGGSIEVFRHDTIVRPRSKGQEKYVEAMSKHDVSFAIGPAGTGKTYLAVAMAVSSLKRGLYRRIVLARPAVEAGERLGFLPGDPQEKVNPYLRPLYDALADMVDYQLIRRYMERDIIEVAPLAFMRGRTLNRAFVILDEAQNTTRLQMKMFLTRLGSHSKAVITGDITQTDLPDGEVSGLAHARHLLKSIEGIHFCYLNRLDIVRHRLVQDIVDAYENESSSRHDGRRNDAK